MNRGVPAVARRPGRNEHFLARWAAAIRDVFTELLSPYHPERHYMRGGRTGGMT
jgi:hypothetical protein